MNRQSFIPWVVLSSSCLVVSAISVTRCAPDPGARAVKESDRATNGHRQWYPYIVPEVYVDPKTASGDGIVRPFGHGLYLVLVQDLNGMVRNVTQEDVTRMSTTPKVAYNQAYANLEQLMSAHQVKMMAYPKGPNDMPFIIMGDHWCTAACIVLPGTYEFAKKNLHCERVVAIIPHRDCLLLFPMPDKAGLNKLREFAKKNEGDGLKPLSFEPFELTTAGPIELK